VTEKSVQTSGALPAAPIVAAGSALMALPILYLVNPNTTHVPLCPLHAATGLWCPLCGATRATYSLLHGDVVTALHDNALYVVGLPLLLLLWWRWYEVARSGGSGRVLPRTTTVAVIAVAVVFGVVRNLPAGSWLAPPA
jgi:hypothetical protein